MISNIRRQDSFGENIAYCLEDKLDIQTQQVIYKDRAEVLHYNQCYGDKEELTRQFDEIAQTNLKMSRPVIHIVLSFHPEEQVQKSRLADIARGCARHMAFDTHQYIAVLHKDRPHQHMHLLVNKVGMDGQSVKDSHSYRRLVNFCRAMELKYDLRPELSPRCYLPKVMRHIPRHGVRLEKLQRAVEYSLGRAADYESFEMMMSGSGYYIHRTEKGIAFRDWQKVVFQGSEVGYPLHKIEETLSIDRAQRQAQAREKEMLALRAQQEKEECQEQLRELDQKLREQARIEAMEKEMRQRHIQKVRESERERMHQLEQTEGPDREYRLGHRR